MAIEKGKFPTSTASFRNIRLDGMYYVDKTALAWRLADERKVVFLSRPRRFGKSMLLSTLASYFGGERELFEGLRLQVLEEAKGANAWVKHPVLRFDFSKRGASVEGMQQIILREVRKLARRNGLTLESESALEALDELFERLDEAGFPRVAVLIDEYDSPILDALVKGDDGLLDEVKTCLRNFYKTLKASDESLRFLMATGVSQLRQVGLFSGFNNIVDISFDGEYNAICGISEQEIHEYLSEQLIHMANTKGWSEDKLMQELKYKYDGYRFSEKEEDVYNPYGLVHALCDCRLDDYWSLTGTMSSVDALIPRYDALGVLNLDGQLRASRTELMQFSYEHSDPLAFLYQTGYLTIKGVEADGQYRLDFPNQEVRESIMSILAPRTLGIMRDGTLHGLQRNLVRALNGTDVKALEACIQAFLASLPHDHDGDTEEAWALRECRYRDAVHLIFAGVRGDVRVEQIGAGGISDVEILGERMVVVLELKMKRGGMTATRALEQAVANSYTAKHIGGQKPVWAVGAVIGKKAHIEWEERCVWEGC
ncbi:MAG: hypothetical protein CSA07_05450 [Bacteroidia bacterium]|nr:MAG: hypothetical protein CSA07_05450 [Bacteroidia bacterium]